MFVRTATVSDAAACAAVYAPYVNSSAITFETAVPSEDEFVSRIAAALERHVWLVVENAGEVVGYAYGSEFKSRAAYRWACEVSVYLATGLRRAGAGRALYDGLLPRLAERGYLTAVAGMTLPNDASVGLHEAFGFEPVGVYQQVGWKLGAWHDVLFMQRPLGDGPGSAVPAEPASLV